MSRVPSASADADDVKDLDVHDEKGPAVGADEEVYDEVASAHLVWKQDVRIMPIAIWTYLLCYLDRSNIGNAKVANLDKGHNLLKDVHATDRQYTIALMLFFVAYILFETPSNVALKVLRPSRWIALLCLVWGAITMALGAVHTFAQLAAVRFLLGAVEAGLFPGFVYYLSFWYRPEERSMRVALILASATLAGAFGGALATGITYMDGAAGIHAWRWIFILEGIPSVLTSLLILLLFPDYPEISAFLTPAEKALSVARLAGPNSARGHDRLTWADAREMLVDWRLYLHYLAYIGISAPFSSLSLFSPTIVGGLGYTGVKANLFTVPPYAVAWIFTISVAYAGDRMNRRGMVAAVCALIAAIGFALLGALPGDNFKARYGLLFPTYSAAFGCIPPLLGWLSTNVRGTTAATLAIPLNVSFGGFGQIIGVWIYKTNEAPAFKTGNFVNMGFLLMTALVSSGLLGMYHRRNVGIVRRGGDERMYTL